MPYLLSIVLVAPLLAATHPDFAGTFVSEKRKGSPDSGSSIRVVQTDSYIEITRIDGNTTTTNRFPLDGSEGTYITETGVSGKSKARFEQEVLVLEYAVASRPSTDRPSIRFHTREVWKLSKDKNTLAIKTEIDSPDMPTSIIVAAFPNNPRTDKFQRKLGAREP